MLLFPTLGLGVGAVVFGLAAAQINAQDPHDLLDVVAPDRVYVTTSCRHSQTALDLLDQTPGERPVLAIPLDIEASADRARLCRPAVSLLRREGSLWWNAIPEEYVCTRLVASAKAWLAAEVGSPSEVPAWVVGGQIIDPGVSTENLALLRAEGVLAGRSTHESIP